MSKYIDRSKRKKHQARYGQIEIDAQAAASQEYYQSKEQEEIESELHKLLVEQAYYDAEYSLYQYLKFGWKFIATGEYVDSWYIEAICDHVQGCIENKLPGNSLIVSIPPRHLKSSICSVAAPTWTWGPHNKPNTKFLSFSYNQQLSTRDALKSRRIIQTNWFQNGWGDRFSLAGDQNAKTRYESNHMGYRIASSVTGSATGEGYDCLIIDDPINALQSGSEVELQKVIEWWSNAMPSRADDPLTARRIIIMQRLHQNDLIGHIQATEMEGGNDGSTWTHLDIPMEYSQRYWHSPLGWEDPREDEGELLSPERFPASEVRKLKKKMGPYRYSAQYQQEPVPTNDGIIKRKWFRYYEIHKPYEMVWQSWDLTQDSGESADYVVGTVWAKIGGDRYLLDMFRDKWDVNEQAAAIVRASRRYPMTRAVLIENKANGHAVFKLLKDPIQIKRIHQYSVPGLTLCDPKKMGGDKKARLLLCASEFSSGSIFFPTEKLQPWISDVEKELCGFPKFRTDDIVDSISQALNWVAQFGGGSAELQYPMSLVERYEEIQRNKKAKTEPIFGGVITQRGIKDIFMDF